VHCTTSGFVVLYDRHGTQGGICRGGAAE
jgi:hypothetical protein